ncbi:MAG: hypothetical protein II773_04465 [Oscillospiraceae bacterium]|nr:hypothetical protein [Oscillospiraceae bacterium]
MGNTEKMIISSGKKKFPVAGGIAIGVAAVAAVGAAAAFTVPSAKNAINMAFASPADYYSSVIKSGNRDNAKKDAEAYAAYCKEYTENASYSGEISAEFGKALFSTIGITDADAVNLYCTYDMARKDTDQSADITLGIGSNPLLDIKEAVSGQTIYLSMPTVSDKWLKIDTEALAEEMGADAGLPQTKGEFTFNDGTVITEKRMNAIYNRYTNIYLSYAKDVKLIKNVEKTSESGVGGKYTEADVTMSAADMTEMIGKMAEEAKKDEDIKAIWNSFGMTSEDFDKYMDQLISSAGNEDAEGTAEIKLFIDKKGKICGSEVVLSGKDDKVTVSGMKYVDKNKVSVEGQLTDTDGEGAKLVLDGTVNNGIIGGEGKLDINAGDEVVTVNIKYSDIDTKALEKGRLLGSVNISGDIDTGDDEMKLVYSADLVLTEKDEKLNGAVSLGKDELVKFTATAVKGETKDVVIPSGEVLDITKDEDVEKFAESIDLTKLKENIEKCRGELGDTFTDTLLSLFEGTSGYGSYDYGDYNYDDYNYDDFDYNVYADGE